LQTITKTSDWWGASFAYDCGNIAEAELAEKIEVLAFAEAELAEKIEVLAFGRLV
jgi:hypothetical protein